MSAANLAETANAIAAGGKDIVAADETFPTIKKRLQRISTENNRRN